MSLRKVLLTSIVVALPVLAGAAQQEPVPAPALLAPAAEPQHDEAEIPEGGMPQYVKEETPAQRAERIAAIA